MKLFNARVEWYKDFDNIPKFVLLIDENDISEFIFEQYNNGLWIGESNGLMMAYKANRHAEGCSGRSITITTTSGDTTTLVGPLIVGASAINAAGKGPCMEAIITTSAKDFYKHFGASYAIHLNLARMAAKMAQVYLVEIDVAASIGAGTDSQSIIAAAGIEGHPKMTFWAPSVSPKEYRKASPDRFTRYVGTSGYCLRKVYFDSAMMLESDNPIDTTEAAKSIMLQDWAKKELLDPHIMTRTGSYYDVMHFDRIEFINGEEDETTDKE